MEWAPARLLTKRSQCGIFQIVTRKNQEGGAMAMESVMLSLGTPAPRFRCAMS